MAFRRGEVWSYSPVLPRPGQSLLRLLVSADGLNDSPLPVLIGLQVVDTDPENLLAVALEGHGWAVTTSIEPVMRRRLTERVGVIGPQEQDAVDQALKAALELD